ncbi:MAG: hypothetical protein E7A85_00105 [Anaerococcus sp.]|nr:hypothetical protein [Anaerococcus sp.]
MLDLKKLKKEREEAYDVWFERWWQKANIEKEIDIANSKGYTAYTIFIRNYDDYTQDRMSDKHFLKNLKKKLPGFGVSFDWQATIYSGVKCLHGVQIWW